jgi:hypothetical protein
MLHGVKFAYYLRIFKKSFGVFTGPFLILLLLTEIARATLKRLVETAWRRMFFRLLDTLIKKCILGHHWSCHIFFINPLLFLLCLRLALIIAIIAIAVVVNKNNKSVPSSAAPQCPVRLLQSHRPGVHKSRAPARRGDYILCRGGLIFIDPQYGTCFISPFWRLEFLGSF